MRAHTNKSYESCHYVKNHINRANVARNQNERNVKSGQMTILSVKGIECTTEKLCLIEYTDLVSRRRSCRRFVRPADSSCAWPCPRHGACPGSAVTRCWQVDPDSSSISRRRWGSSAASRSTWRRRSRRLSRWSNTRCCKCCRSTTSSSSSSSRLSGSFRRSHSRETPRYTKATGCS